MTWLTAFFGKTKFYLLAAGAFIATIFAAYWRIREDGKNAARLEQAKARDNLQEHYDEIDRQAIDPDRSYDRLRGLSDDAHSR
ncbi:hypothetical protein [Devosia sp. Root635]|uniref:hypothetical protein n=1 Tax=Devosia sp. Root635 TaxID=1736575 RepID=UPI00070162B9|nr:hypothetical protein [Devosia sp. Root635]KRA42082.1 hypothetical protein ASD80_10165 [Devosia sp. Root635]